MRIPTAFDALRNRDYRLLWLGAVASLSAAQMRQLANGYLAFELTGSAAILGAVILGQSLPSFVLSMFGGVVADRVKRRQLLLITQTSICLDSVLMAVLVLTGWVEVWHIALLGVWHGSVLAFNQPSRQAYMVELAGSENVTQAIALYSSGQTAMRVIGPLLAAGLIGVPFVGIKGAFIAIAAIYALPAFMIFMIKARPDPVVRARRAIWWEFKDGISYIKNHQVLRILVIVGIVPPLLGHFYQQFLPVFADLLDAGPTGLGLMAFFNGIGAFMGAMSVATFGQMRRRGLAQLCAGAFFGAMLVAFGAAGYFPLALITLIGVGFGFASFQTLNNTLTLAFSDPAYYGRMSAVQQISNSFSSFLIVPIGLLVDAIGAPVVVMGAGVLILVFWGFIALFVKAYGLIELPARREAQGTDAEVAPGTTA